MCEFRQSVFISRPNERVFSMMIRKVSVMLCAVFAIGLMAFAAEKEFKQTCPVSGQPAKEDKTADYKGAKVYFCCGDCPTEFTKNTAKYATKANLQLAATGQAKETKCPLSGQKLNPDTTVEVSGVKVTFCCDKCQAKVKEAKGDAQIDLVFKDEPFGKAFEITKK